MTLTRKGKRKQTLEQIGSYAPCFFPALEAFHTFFICIYAVGHHTTWGVRSLLQPVVAVISAAVAGSG